MDIHPSLLKRKIIHIDMDCFYAAIEMRDDPRLRGRPIAVGGDPRTRGVVATANYEARAFGVKSAMSCARAARLCPQLLFVRPRFEAYAQVSRQIRAIMARFTERIEPLSLDEAYLDVTHGGNPETGEPMFAMEIAAAIRKLIEVETGLTASAGVAPNKMVAKIASDVNKPNGMTVIRPDRVFAFVQALPVRRIPFVGPVTEKRLHALGILVCSDFNRFAKDDLRSRLGSMGTDLYDRAQGIDESPVETSWERKSMGSETTFSEDLIQREDMVKALSPLAEDVAQGLRNEKLKGRTITLKVKYADFKQITRARTLTQATDAAREIHAIVVALLDKIDPGAHAVRLLGVSVSKFEDESVFGHAPSMDVLFPED